MKQGVWWVQPKGGCILLYFVKSKNGNKFKNLLFYCVFISINVLPEISGMGATAPLATPLKSATASLLQFPSQPISCIYQSFILPYSLLFFHIVSYSLLVGLVSHMQQLSLLFPFAIQSVTKPSRTTHITFKAYNCLQLTPQRIC